MYKYVRKLRSRKLQKLIELFGSTVLLMCLLLLLEPMFMLACQLAYVLFVISALVLLWSNIVCSSRGLILI